MIIIRVLLGRGWTKEAATGSTARFVTRSGVATSGTGIHFATESTAINLRSIAKSDVSSRDLPFAATDGSKA